MATVTKKPGIMVDAKSVFASDGGRKFDPSLPALVFLHGAGMSHSMWALQSRYFAHHGYNVLAVDLPGHGRSQGPALTSIGDMADWVWRLLDTLGARKAALVGHSMGTFIALEAAAREPGRVIALGLIATASKMPVHPELQAAADANRHLAYELVVDWGFGSRSHLGGHRPPGLWMMGAAMSILEHDGKGSQGGDFTACAAYEGAQAAAAKVACPTVVIAGSEDRMTPPKAGRAVADMIAGARFEVVDCGHMMMIEKPDETLDALIGTL
ncbi:MAG: alpha/beta fold hydrolase [Alphaproteobacteria bacterium]